MGEAYREACLNSEPYISTASNNPVDDVPIPPAFESPASTPAPNVHADPEEVDISQHYYEPRQTARVTPEQPAAQDELRRLMMGLERPAATPAGTPQPPNPQNDPFAAIMAQMMPEGAPPGAPPFPGTPGASPFGQPPAQPTSLQSSIWRILHALFALSLGFYVALSTPFAGTLSEREASPSDTTTQNINFFYIFASAEALLLTTRFLLDSGKHAPSGLLGTVVRFLPPQTAGYIKVVLRYGQIFATVRADLLVCVFVLGVAGLWRSFVVA